MFRNIDFMLENIWWNKKQLLTLEKVCPASFVNPLCPFTQHKHKELTEQGKLPDPLQVFNDNHCMMLALSYYLST